jgi:hypothetical protein
MGNIMRMTSLFSGMDLPGQIAEGALVLEHALIILLLLVGLLSIHKEQRRYVPWVVLAGVALSLFTPVHTLALAWPFISALVLPPLLWQVAVRLATAQFVFTWRAGLAWLLTALLIGLALGLGGGVPPASALFLGILAASLLWQVRERATGNTDLGAFGQLALALLLAEVDVTLHPLGPFLGSLFVGAGFGLLLGYIGVRVALRLPVGEPRSLFCLGLAYLAYLVGAMPGASGVITATMTALMVAVYGDNVGLWPTMAALPAPLNRRGIFLLMAGALLLLSWQAHVPLTVTHVTGIGLGLVAAAVSVLVGRWLAPVPEEVARSLPQALLRKEGKVFLLLLGTLLLWPQEAVLKPWPVAVALLAALVAMLILRIVLYPLFDLIGIEPRPPGASTAENGEYPDE